MVPAPLSGFPESNWRMDSVRSQEHYVTRRIPRTPTFCRLRRPHFASQGEASGNLTRLENRSHELTFPKKIEKNFLYFRNSLQKIENFFLLYFRKSLKNRECFSLFPEFPILTILPLLPVLPVLPILPILTILPIISILNYIVLVKDILLYSCTILYLVIFI